MATFRSRDPEEARAFCQGLRERGYRQAPPATDWKTPIKRGTFRVRIERDRNPERHGPWHVVVYYEARTGPKAEPPRVGPATYHRRTSRTCPTPGHGDRPIYARGVCTACYRRWHYWESENAERVRRDQRKRSRTNRAVARARERQEEANP